MPGIRNTLSYIIKAQISVRVNKRSIRILHGFFLCLKESNVLNIDILCFGVRGSELAAVTGIVKEIVNQGLDSGTARHISISHAAVAVLVLSHIQDQHVPATVGIVHEPVVTIVAVAVEHIRSVEQEGAQKLEP